MASEAAASASASATETDGRPDSPADAASIAAGEGPAAADETAVVGVGGLPTAASKSLRAQVEENEMIRCAVTGERIHHSGYSNYQRRRYDMEYRRSRKGTEM